MSALALTTRLDILIHMLLPLRVFQNCLCIFLRHHDQYQLALKTAHMQRACRSNFRQQKKRAQLREDMAHIVAWVEHELS